jgi:hypothetical protein
MCLLTSSVSFFSSPLSHSRSVGDDTRAMVLARWGGMGHHRYQVGFSGDVAALTWGNLAYQPYFSATAANVLFPSWSHDIEGPSADLEMYTRWLQVGAFSGTMRSHERGMSAGGCANTKVSSTASGTVAVDPPFWGPETGTCAIIAPWAVGPKFFDANRRALQSRERLLPYIYTAHRSLFDTGLGLIRPLYYDYPKLDGAYRMNRTHHAQYFFGPDIIVAPVTAPASASNKDPSQALACKETWLPPGAWFDGLTGTLQTVTLAAGEVATRGFTLGEIPAWYRAGSVIPYIPLRSLKSLVGVADKQWTSLGFRIIPASTTTRASNTSVYEDDGKTTAYLAPGASAWTTINVDRTNTVTNINITSAPDSGSAFYASFPKTRHYQLRLPNTAPPGAVTVGGVAVPFVRFGAVAARRTAPPTNQWYYSFDEDEGIGPVIDLVDVPTHQPVHVEISPRSAAYTATPTSSASASSASASTDAAAEEAMNAGLYGTLIRSIYAHAQMDVDRSNPDSNSPGPAYLSQLSSVAVALERLGDPSSPVGAFAETVATVRWPRERQRQRQRERRRQSEAKRQRDRGTKRE